ncbi:MAG: flagellar motor protein MotB, partial [Synergistaceae bacterium]|nr:flagellar motor protein MotB [Synergistaceae bacterium]
MARSKKKKEDSSPGAPLWLVTYGDMVTLVLTFFVLLFSMSSIDVQKFE